MKSILSIATTIIIAVSAGCDTVVLDAPIGEPLTQGEMEGFVGTWIVGDSGSIEIRLINDGGLALGCLCWNAKQQRYDASNVHVDVRKCGDAIVALKRNDARGLPFFRVELVSDTEIKSYEPNPEKVQAAIEAGKLRGNRVSGEHGNGVVVIEASSPLTKAMFSEKDLSALYDDMWTLRRVKARDVNEKAEPSVGADSR